MINRETLQKKFRIFVILSFVVLLVEVAGGIITNSLALISDAGHVLIDLIALSLAYFAIRLSKRPSTNKFSFGYYRAEILAAIINGLVLILVTLFIFYQSYLRLVNPQPVESLGMLAISILGLAANVWVMARMHGHEKESLNVRGAYLHVLSDTVSSIGVIVAAILILLTGNYIIDPIMSAIIGLFILTSSYGMIKESIVILMEATPPGISLEKVLADMRKVKGVREVHDLHVWCISSDVLSLTSHILIDAKDVKSMNRIIAEVNRMLKKKHNITHTVLQSECESCADAKCRYGHGHGH